MMRTTDENIQRYDVPVREYRMLAATTEVDYPYFPFRISIDFVLVHNASESHSKGKYREFFEKAVQKEGLIIRHQMSGQTHFTLISTPFHRLSREAESLQMCFPLKDCQVKPGMPSCCIPLSKIFVTDDTVRFINAPFQRKHGALFVNYHDEKSFFTPAQRGYLTYQILTKIDISKDLKHERLGDSQDVPEQSTVSITSDEQLRRKGLTWLLMRDVYEEAFVLHAPSKEEPYFKAMQNGSVKTYNEVISEIELDPRKSLSNAWERWYKFQPLNKIRDYFGEQIAYYFAWQGTFLTLLWPAVIFGFIVFIYGFVDSISSSRLDWNHCKVVKFNGETENVACGMRNGLTLFFSMLTQWFMSSFDTKMNAFFAVFMSIWGSVFVQVWKRNNSVLSYQWNSDDFHAIEPDRPEFRGSKMKEDPVTGEDIWISPALFRYLKMIGSFFFVSFSMLIVILSLMLVTLLKIWMVYNFQCTKEYTFHCWLSAAFLPSVLNTLSAMGLGAVYSNLVARFNAWENHRTESEHNNSLIVKIFAFQMVNTYTSLFYVAFVRPESHGLQPNGLFGLGKEFKDTCLDDTCSSLLALQLLTHTLIKPVPKFLKDVVIPGEDAYPYCSDIKHDGTKSMAITRCTSQRDSLALCNLIPFQKELPSQYRNFMSLPGVSPDGAKYYGGSVEMADYCPFLQEFEWKLLDKEQHKDSRCELEGNGKGGEDILEVYGENSKCFEFPKPWTERKCGRIRVLSHYMAGCYEYQCTNGTLYVGSYNATDMYPCYAENQKVHIKKVVDGWLREGSLICPKCSDYCNNCGPPIVIPDYIGDSELDEPCSAFSRFSIFRLLIFYLVFL